MLLARLLTQAGAAGPTVSTVDAFQGAERDVILVSCCRVHELGFLASRRRLNVTITRARHHLLLIGSAPALLTDGAWAALLEEAAALPASFYATQPTAHALTELGTRMGPGSEAVEDEENEPFCSAAPASREVSCKEAIDCYTLLPNKLTSFCSV